MKSHITKFSVPKGIGIAVGVWILYTFGLMVFATICTIPFATPITSVDLSSIDLSSDDAFSELVAASSAITFSDQYYLAELLSIVAAVLLFLIWYRHSFDINHSKESIKIVFKKWFSPKNLGSLLLFACLLYSLSVLVGMLVQAIAPQAESDFNTLMDDFSAQPIWYVILYACVVGPVGEELVFRGIVQHALARTKLPVAAVIIIQAVLFSSMHLIPYQMAYAFAAGLFLGWLCYKTHSVLPGIIVHIFNNTISTVPSYLPQMDVISWAILVIAVCAAVCCVILMVRKVIVFEPAPTREVETINQGFDPFVEGRIINFEKLNETGGQMVSGSENKTGTIDT